MIEHVIKMFPGETDFLFICSNEALAETPLRATLERLAPRGRIVAIASHNSGRFTRCYKQRPIFVPTSP